MDFSKQDNLIRITCFDTKAPNSKGMFDKQTRIVDIEDSFVLQNL